MWNVTENNLDILSILDFEKHKSSCAEIYLLSGLPKGTLL